MKPHIAKMQGGLWGVWRSRHAHQRWVHRQWSWPSAVGPDLPSAFKLALVVAADNRRGQ